MNVWCKFQKDPNERKIAKKLWRIDRQNNRQTNRLLKTAIQLGSISVSERLQMVSDVSSHPSSVYHETWLETSQTVCQYLWSAWALARNVKLRVALAPRMPGTFSPPPRVINPDMHHDTCVTHVPWCMPRSLTSGDLWSGWQRKCSRHSRRMRNPQFYVTGKRPIGRWRLDHHRPHISWSSF